MDFQADTEIYPAGTVIGGYEILSHLASGGMAHVYIALQNKLSRKVAFKVLSSTFSTNVSVSSKRSLPTSTAISRTTRARTSSLT